MNNIREELGRSGPYGPKEKAERPKLPEITGILLDLHVETPGPGVWFLSVVKEASKLLKLGIYCSLRGEI